jgi:hypothetical protein
MKYHSFLNKAGFYPSFKGPNNTYIMMKVDNHYYQWIISISFGIPIRLHIENT